MSDLSHWELGKIYFERKKTKSISSTSHWLKNSGKNNPMSAKFKLLDYGMDELTKDTLSYCNVFEKFESLGTQEDLLLTTERDVQS